MPTRVSTLTRRPTDEQHQPFSIELQDTKLAAYIKSQDDWRLVRKYTDNKSGATLDRDGLQRALADARAGLYDLLLVYKVDRLARTVRGLAQILDELDAAGVAFRSATELFDTSTAAGRMLVQMLGVIAEFERATIIDRVIGGMERKAARGEWNGGYRPFGYQVKKSADKTHILVPDLAEAALVPVIFDLYVDHRLGAKSIAVWLTDRGHRTRAGRPWSHEAVLPILRNHVYLGEVFFRDTWYPGQHQPLIDQATFDAAQALLTERGDAHAKRASNASEYLLSGRVRCVGCGKHFIGSAAHGNRYRYRYRYYVCFSRQRYGADTCAADRLPAEQLDQAVLEALLATFQRTDLFERAVAASRTQAEALHDQHQAELAALSTEISRAEAAIERYLDAFEAGSLPEDQCGQRVQRLGGKIAELRVRQDELRLAVAAINLQSPSRQELADLAEQVRLAVQTGPMPTRKKVVHALVQEIRVESCGNIVPVFRVPGATPSAPGRRVRTMGHSVRRQGLEPRTR
jgi:site-specific DNA recombinase